MLSQSYPTMHHGQGWMLLQHPQPLAQLLPAEATLQGFRGRRGCRMPVFQSMLVTASLLCIVADETSWLQADGESTQCMQKVGERTS